MYKANLPTAIVLFPRRSRDRRGDMVAIPNGDYYIFSATVHENSRCLDVPIGSPDKSMDDHTKIQLYQYHGGDNQLWRVRRVGSTDFYTIVSAHSGKALDVPNGSLSFAQLQQYQFHDPPSDAHHNQQWRFLFHQGVHGTQVSSPDAYSIRNRHSNLAVDLPNGDFKPGNWIQQYTARHAQGSLAYPYDNQKWYLRRRNNSGGLVNVNPLPGP